MMVDSHNTHTGVDAACKHTTESLTHVEYMETLCSRHYLQMDKVGFSRNNLISINE